MLEEQTDNYTLRAKTGWSVQMEKISVGGLAGLNGRTMSGFSLRGLLTMFRSKIWISAVAAKQLRGAF